jgi:hypothetical protein
MTMAQKRIVIIGNAPTALCTEDAALIDSCDVVVRINNYQTEGLEKWVGSKTTVWIRSCMPDIRPRSVEDFRQVIIAIPPNDPLYFLRYPYAKYLSYRIRKAGSTPYVIPAKFWFQQHRVWGVSSLRWLSSGMIGILHFLSLYETIYIKGFDFFQKVDGHPRHYFEPQKKLASTGFHSGGIERNIVRFYRDNGRIIQLGASQ